GLRSEVNVPAGAKIEALLKDLDAEAAGRLERHRGLILRLARLESIATTSDTPKGSIQDVIDGATLILPLAGVIDIAAETQRLKKEIGKLEGEAGGLEKKLGNEKFVANAPEAVVEENRERLANALEARDRLAEALARLQAA
ncbi:MAG: hypothetical protein KDB46_14040, partial [Solirubrobacterales bacterium]|nr:hypothetical protein [Solirubrobacterales bacterium]